jgi:site-specific DNA-methyltransferase (cytosine-N4-specific)
MMIPTCFRSIDRFGVVLGDVRRTTQYVADNSFQSICVSPPYFELRDYECEGQVGLEETPEAYIETQVQIFREARRILRPDGTLWLNLGDKYSANGSGNSKHSKEVGRCGDMPLRRRSKNHGRAKNLLGLPWRLTFALQDDGWNLRSEIIWSKTNPMPESPRDRPPREHEHIFLFTKSLHYYYDRFGAPEDVVYGDAGDIRPCRTVWEIGTQKALVKHFAAFPTALPEKCFRLGASTYGCCPACRKPYRRIIESKRVATRPGKTSISYKPGNWSRDGESHDSIAMMMERKEKIGNRDPERHTTKYILKGWESACNCNAGDAVPCLVGDIYHGIGRSMIAADRLSMDYLGFEIEPQCIQNTMIELDADRKRRSKGPRKKRIAKPYIQPPLIAEE